MIALSAMILSILNSIGFVAGVTAMAVWASRRPTEQSVMIDRLTQISDEDPP